MCVAQIEDMAAGHQTNADYRENCFFGAVRNRQCPAHEAQADHRHYERRRLAMAQGTKADGRTRDNDGESQPDTVNHGIKEHTATDPQHGDKEDAAYAMDGAKARKE